MSCLSLSRDHKQSPLSQAFPSTPSLPHARTNQGIPPHHTITTTSTTTSTSTMETTPLLAALVIMVPLLMLAQREEILDSPAFHLSLAALLLCLYKALSLYMGQRICEEQILKSCRAEAAEQAEPRRAELQALQAEISSQARTIEAYERERLTLMTRQDGIAARYAAHQRESRRLRDRLQQAESHSHDRTTVEAARLIEATWESVKDVMAKAGIDVRTHRGGWTGAVEELCQPKSQALSAVEKSNEAISSDLEKERKELIKEKASKHAAQKQAELLNTRLDDEKARARILEIDNEQMKIDVEREKRHRAAEASKRESTEKQRATRSEVEQQLAKERADMFSEMDELYLQEHARLLTQFNEAQEQLTLELETAFNEKINEREAATIAATTESAERIKRLKRAKKRQGKQLTEAVDANKQVTEDLDKARSNIARCEEEILHLNKKLLDNVEKIEAQRIATTEEFTKRSNELQHELETAKTTSEQTEKRLTEAERTITKQNEELSTFNQDFNNRVEEKAAEKTVAISETSNELSKKLEQELVETRTTNTQVTEHLTKAESIIGEKEAENNFLQKQNSQFVSDLQAAIQREDCLKEQLAISQGLVVSHQEALTGRGQQIVDLSSQIDSIRQQQGNVDVSMLESDGFGQSQGNADAAMMDSSEAVAGPTSFDQPQGLGDETMLGSTGVTDAPAGGVSDEEFEQMLGWLNELDTNDLELIPQERLWDANDAWDPSWLNNAPANQHSGSNNSNAGFIFDFHPNISPDLNSNGNNSSPALNNRKRKSSWQPPSSDNKPPKDSEKADPNRLFNYNPISADTNACIDPQLLQNNTTSSTEGQTNLSGALGVQSAVYSNLFHFGSNGKINTTSTDGIPTGPRKSNEPNLMNNNVSSTSGPVDVPPSYVGQPSVPGRHIGLHSDEPQWDGPNPFLESQADLLPHSPQYVPAEQYTGATPNQYPDVKSDMSALEGLKEWNGTHDENGRPFSHDDTTNFSYIDGDARLDVPNFEPFEEKP